MNVAYVGHDVNARQRGEHNTRAPLACWRACYAQWRRATSPYPGQLAPMARSSPFSAWHTSSFSLTAVEETRVSEAGKALLYLSNTQRLCAHCCRRLRVPVFAGGAVRERETRCRGVHPIPRQRQMQIHTHVSPGPPDPSPVSPVGA